MKHIKPHIKSVFFLFNSAQRSFVFPENRTEDGNTEPDGYNWIRTSESKIQLDFAIFQGTYKTTKTRRVPATSKFTNWLYILRQEDQKQ